MMPDVFTSFCPNADDLLRRVSGHVSDALLYEIAAADYGHAAKDNLVHLRQIRDHGSFVNPMGWHPRDVLELIRWSEPDDLRWKPGLPGERGHWMRAFACSALLRAAGEPGNRDLRGGWNQTLIQLIDSLRFVGPELYGPSAAFLAWLIRQVEVDGDRKKLGFLMVGLLWFALHLQTTDDVIVTLCQLTSAEAQRQSDLDFGRYSTRWLLGTTCYDQRHARWEQLGFVLLEMDLRGRSPAVRDWIKLIGSELTGT